MSQGKGKGKRTSYNKDECSFLQSSQGDSQWYKLGKHIETTAIAVLQPYLNHYPLPQNITFLATKSFHQSDRWKIARGIMKEIEKIQPNSRHSYLHTITLCVQDTRDRSSWQAALDMFNEMRSKNHLSDAICVSELMGACTKAGKADISRKLMKQALDEGIPLDHCAYNSAIDACNKSGGLWQEALQYLQHMIDSKISPDTGSYSAVITSCRPNDKDEIAFSMLDQMEKNGVTPNIVSYTAAVGCCAKTWTRALDLIEQMRAKGIYPNQVTYTSAIGILGRNSQYSKALEMLDDMKSVSIKPNHFTYTAVLHAMVSHVPIEKTLSILQEMRNAGCTPDHRTYSVMIASLVKANHACTACLRVWKQMLRDGVVPTARMYNHMMIKLLSLQENHLVLLFGKDMQSKGHALDLTTIQIMRSAGIGLEDEEQNKDIIESKEEGTNVPTSKDEQSVSDVNLSKYLSTLSTGDQGLESGKSAFSKGTSILEECAENELRIRATLQEGKGKTSSKVEKENPQEHWEQSVVRLQELDSLRTLAGAKKARRLLDKKDRSADGTIAPVSIFDRTIPCDDVQQTTVRNKNTASRSKGKKHIVKDRVKVIQNPSMVSLYVLATIVGLCGYRAFLNRLQSLTNGGHRTAHAFAS